MMSKAEIGLIVLIVYLFIGTIFWLIGIITAFGGMAGYREYLDEKEVSTPVWFIFLTFIISWPFFIRRKER